MSNVSATAKGRMKPCALCSTPFYCVPSKDVGTEREKRYCSNACMHGAQKFTYEQAVEAFWSKVDKSPLHGGCWVWRGAYRYDGYGHLQFMRKQSSAHQLAYSIAKGEIPAGMWVLHSCDNRSCVSPDHLRLGTRAENMQDAVDRKRLSTAGVVRKLDDNAVEHIRRAYKVGEHGRSNAYALARQFNVHRNTILAAATGKSWRDK